MDNNDILRRIRYALDINDSTMREIFSLCDYEIEEKTIISFLKKEDDEGFLVCSDTVMGYFLDGLIIHKRGKQENKTESPEKQIALNNNIILKKIRIALNFKEEDMLDAFKIADFKVSKSELTAVFRRPNHKNYKECGDQFIRNFLKGLALKIR